MGIAPDVGLGRRGEHQLAIGDIAAVLEIAPNAVKQRLHRARRNLAREYRRLDARPTTPDAPKGGAK